MRIKISLRLAAVTVASLMLVGAPAYAYAEGSVTGDSNTGSGSTTSGSGELKTPPHVVTTEVESKTGGSSNTSTDGTNTTNIEDKTGQQGDHHFTGDKLKLCLKRQTDIGDLMGRLHDRGQKQLDLYNTIATRVETFYTKSGKTLDNYDALVAAVNAQKTVAQAAVDAVKADRSNFKCDGTNPAGTATAFKADLQTEIQALKDYRTAVKNLITGVKSLFPADTTKSSGVTH